MADRHAHVTWEGDLKSGSGTIDEVGSAAFGPLAVTWAARSEEDSGGTTSPEELLAAAHASCFSMALSSGLAKAGTPPQRLQTSATVTFVPGTGITKIALEVEGKGHQIVASDVEVHGRVAGIDAAEFERIVGIADEGCPFSTLIRASASVTVRAHLDS